jgi:ABC-2 type transport system permease protein
MRNTPTLTWRELNAYFFSPVAYIVLTVFLGLSGFVFYLSLSGSGLADMRGWIGATGFILLLVCPIITMRLLAEETRSGTIEMLMTVPVTDAEVVWSKFLGALLFYLFMLLPSAFYVLTLFILGSPDPGPIITGYIGLVLVGSMFLSAGLFCSSLTRNQIIAAILGLVAVFVLWLIGFTGVGGSLGRFLDYVGVVSHLQGFVRGLVDLRDVAYFVTGTGLFLFLSVRALESRKWR